MKIAKGSWIQGQCQEAEACLRKNNSKKANQLVKGLATEKQGKSTTIQDKSGQCLSEENEILNRWSEYCSNLYNYETEGDPIVLDCPQIPDEEHHPILREEVEAAVKALKMGKSSSVDNISAELVQAGGEAMNDILTTISNKIWKTGEWPTTWTQSLVITLQKKGNLQLCQNYRTISLVSHLSKREQTPATSRRDHCRRASRFQSRKEHQRTNIQSQEHHRTNIQSQDPRREIPAASAESLPCLHRLQEGIWQGMTRSPMSNYEEIRVIENLFDKTQSAVLFNGSTGAWFRTTVVERYYCNIICGAPTTSEVQGLRGER